MSYKRLHPSLDHAEAWWGRGRVVIYPPHLGPLSFGVAQDLELVERPPGERKCKVVVFFTGPLPRAQGPKPKLLFHAYETETEII